MQHDSTDGFNLWFRQQQPAKTNNSMVENRSFYIIISYHNRNQFVLFLILTNLIYLENKECQNAMEKIVCCKFDFMTNWIYLLQQILDAEKERERKISDCQTDFPM